MTEYGGGLETRMLSARQAEGERTLRAHPHTSQSLNSPLTGTTTFKCVSPYTRGTPINVVLEGQRRVGHRLRPGLCFLGSEGIDGWFLDAHTGPRLLSVPSSGEAWLNGRTALGQREAINCREMWGRLLKLEVGQN